MKCGVDLNTQSLRMCQTAVLFGSGLATRAFARLYKITVPGSEEYVHIS